MISSNPYHPLQPTAGITHTWMGESWMVDGETSVMMMAMISSNSPSRQGGRTEFLVPELGFSVAAELRNSFWKNVEPPVVFRSEALSSQKEGSRGWPRRPHHGTARPRVARAATWCGPLVARLRLVFWLRESSGKIGTLRYFPGIFLKVEFLHKNETPGQFC